MSYEPLQCQTCKKVCVFKQIAAFAGGESEGTFAVAWECPTCKGAALDVCPVGPVIPTPTCCLNCGNEPEEKSETCAACGILKLPLPEPEKDVVAAAREWMGQGLFRKALLALNRELRHNGDNRAAWEEKFWIFNGLGFPRAKIAVLDKAMALAGAAPTLQVNFGVALAEAGRHPEAIAAYQKYLDQNPTDPERGAVICNQANSYAALKQAGKANVLYQQAISIEPTRSTNYWNYVRFLREQGRMDDALEWASRGTKRAKRDEYVGQLYEDKAFLYAEANEGEGALDAAEAAVAIGPQRLRAIYLHGRALAMVGRLKEARERIQQVLMMDPQNEDGNRAMRLLDQAMGGPKKWWQFWR